MKFRIWLDAARLLLLLLCHIGIASSFVISNPTTPCPDDSESSCYYFDLFLLTDIQALDSSHVCRLLNVYIIMTSWVPPLLRGFNCFNVRLHLILYPQVIVYGFGLATYAWRYATRPKQLLTDDVEETGRVQPSLSDPITEPRDSSMRHLSELMSSPPSVRDSRRESGRRSRLERQRLF